MGTEGPAARQAEERPGGIVAAAEGCSAPFPAHGFLQISLAGEQGGPSALSSRRLGSAQLKQLWSLRLRSRGRQGRGSVWAGGRTADPREPQPQRQSCRARESGNGGRGTKHDACPAHGERAPCLWPAPQAGPREVGGVLGRQACTPRHAFTHTQEPSRAFPHIVYGSPSFCYLSASQPW